MSGAFDHDIAAAESPPADPSWSPERRRAEGWNATARLSAGRIEAFAAVAAHLKSLGLSAPEIRALDPPTAWPCWRISATPCSPA